MPTADRWPQVGDLAVDYRAPVNTEVRPRVGDIVTVREITSTLVITSDQRKYDRCWLTPLNEGQHSARHLVPATDGRVLAARGREHLASLGQMATNLANVDLRMPESVVAALAQIIATANESRVALLALMVEASRIEQESNR